MDLNHWLSRSPLIAILRGVQPREVREIVFALEDAGVAIVEVPLNSPSPLESISILSREFGDRMLIGAGTVTMTSQVAEVAAAGGKIVLTPHADARIVRVAKSEGLISVPGFSTATEAFALLEAGADGLKLFPAGVFGISLYKALRAVLPADTAVVPVGGVEVEDVITWLSAGAKGLGIGSSLYRPGDSPESVRQKACAFLSEVERFTCARETGAGSIEAEQTDLKEHAR